jgi:hypothetical protein
MKRKKLILGAGGTYARCHDRKAHGGRKQKITTWLTRNHRSPPACPFCWHSNWLIGDHLVQPSTLGLSGNIQLGGLGYPHVMLISVGRGRNAGRVVRTNVRRTSRKHTTTHKFRTSNRYPPTASMDSFRRVFSSSARQTLAR